MRYWGGTSLSGLPLCFPNQRTVFGFHAPGPMFCGGLLRFFGERLRLFEPCEIWIARPSRMARSVASLTRSLAQSSLGITVPPGRKKRGPAPS